MTVVHEIEFVPLVLLLGILLVGALLVKSLLSRTALPSLVGFLILGFALRWVDIAWLPLPQGGGTIIEFLGKIGLVCLLFRVGLESDLHGLVGQLRNAAAACLSNVMVTALLGYVCAAYILGFELVPSLLVATAFTATSVGITVSIWQDAGALKSENGALLVDLAELDDVLAIVLMGLLFAVIPILHDGTGNGLWETLWRTGGLFALKLLGFGVFCYLLSRFLEGPLTRFLEKVESLPDISVSTVGIGLIIAALAGLLGFSLAIGAFFAGLVFSRDNEILKLERFFEPVFDLFAPFFFISIGLLIEPGVMGGALWIGLVLLAGAIVSKIVANGIPVAMIRGLQGGLLVGVSMVPRAEISLVIMQEGLKRGNWAVSPKLYGGMVLVAAVTSILSPVAVRSMLERWPQNSPDG